jgi:hypothetical protein
VAHFLLDGGCQIVWMSSVANRPFDGCPQRLLMLPAGGVFGAGDRVTDVCIERHAGYARIRPKNAPFRIAPGRLPRGRHVPRAARARLPASSATTSPEPITAIPARRPAPAPPDRRAAFQSTRESIVSEQR